jgi:hypothetical protein
VLGPSAVDDAKDKMWELLRDASGGTVDRHDVSTWDVAHGWKPNVKNGLFNTHGAGQSDLLWFIRMQPKVKDVFRAIYDGADDLLVSFTGCNAFRPWQFDPSWRTKGGWYHVDQNAKRPGRAGKVSHRHHCHRLTASLHHCHFAITFIIDHDRNSPRRPPPHHTPHLHHCCITNIHRHYCITTKGVCAGNRDPVRR